MPDWDIVITKSANQSVTNNATPQNDTELFTSIVASAFYYVELNLLFSGNNTTGDYQWDFSMPNITGGHAYGFSANFGTTLLNLLTGLQGTALVFPTAPRQMGVTAAGEIMVCLVRFSIRTMLIAGTLQFRFANVAAAAGRTSTTHAGSTLRIKRIEFAPA